MRKTLLTATTPVIFESLIFFPGLLWMQPCTEPPSSEGAMGGVQRLSSCMPNARSTCSQALHVPKGMCEKVRKSMCYGPRAGFPRRVTLAAPKGEWPYTEATPGGAAPTSPPEGVFRHKRLMELVELSGRTTGRLGYTWPTTAYAIGGTATLALRYSIISATAAARTRPQ